MIYFKIAYKMVWYSNKKVFPKLLC